MTQRQVHQSASCVPLNLSLPTCTKVGNIRALLKPPGHYRPTCNKREIKGHRKFQVPPNFSQNLGPPQPLEAGDKKQDWHSWSNVRGERIGESLRNHCLGSHPNLSWEQLPSRKTLGDQNKTVKPMGTGIPQLGHSWSTNRHACIYNRVQGCIIVQQCSCLY